VRIAFTRRAPNREICDRWSGAPATSPPDGLPTSTHERYESVVELRTGEDADAAFDRVRARLFAYDIFSPRLVRFVLCPNGIVELDALIVQHVGVGPIRLESAVRIVDVWDHSSDEQRDPGFRYVTLAGHPERGVESFAVQRDKSGEVLLTVEARSEAGTIITRIGRPVARRVQVAATRTALRRLSGGGR
jgi:uncharacterized protein (UPF0548 family)